MISDSHDGWRGSTRPGTGVSNGQTTGISRRVLSLAVSALLLGLLVSVAVGGVAATADGTTVATPSDADADKSTNTTTNGSVWTVPAAVLPSNQSEHGHAVGGSLAHEEEADAYEPNDQRSDASKIFLGQEITDLTLTPYDEDYYAVEVQQGVELSGSVDIEQTQSDVMLQLVGPNGTVFDRMESVTDNGTVSYSYLSAGTYYIKVSHYNDSTASYSLSTSVRESTLENDEYEPNDDRSSAPSIGTDYQYVGAAMWEDESDYFAVQLDANERLNVTASFAQTVADLEMELVSADGTVLDFSRSDTNYEFVSAAVETAGTYYIHVYNDGSATSPYALYVNSISPPSENDDFEPNDQPSTATEIAGDQTLSNLTSLNDEEDYYAVDLQADERLNTSIEFDQETSDLDLFVRWENGTELARSVSTSDDEFVSVSAPVSGTYYIHVSNWGQETAPYTLSTTVTEPVELDDRTVAVDPASATTTVGGTTTVDVTIDATNGVQGHSLLLALDNESVADITGVSLPESPDFRATTIGPNNRTVDVEVGYFDPLARSGPTTLLTVTLDGEATGTTQLSLSDVRVTDANNDQYGISETTTGTLSVVDGSSTVSVTGAPATNLDDDALLEDVDGDGAGNIFDALAYYNNRDSEAITSNPQYFDFDGDGEAGTVFDALALYNEVN